MLCGLLLLLLLLLRLMPHPLRPDKTLSAGHASYSGRIELKPLQHVPDGLPVATNMYGFWLKVLVRRDKFENKRKKHKYSYTSTY